MSEQEQSINITLAGKEFEMTRNNSFLYTFVGRAALFNHVWLKRDDLPPLEDESMLQSTYLFENLRLQTAEQQQHWQDVYSRIVARMTELQYPMYLNMDTPSNTDVNAYIATVQSDDLDHVPDDWS